MHALILFVLNVDYWIWKNPVRTKKIHVTTVRYAPPPAPIKVEKKAPVATAPKPVVKPPVPKPEIKKKPPVSSKPVINQNKPIESELLKEIERNFDSITEPLPKPVLKPEIELPTPNLVFHFSIENEDVGPTDAERIALLLQELLQLPEYGEVRAQLKISRLGQLESFDILESKSKKNSDFLKNRLPEVQFPCLNESATLTIVFRNAN